MNIKIHSTTKVVEFNGVPARIWEGVTESGVEVHCFITRIAVNKNEDCTQIEKELQEHKPPQNKDIESYPLRMILFGL
jgi:hypothetical protein